MSSHGPALSWLPGSLRHRLVGAVDDLAVRRAATLASRGHGDPVVDACEAFEALYQPDVEDAPPPPARVQQAIVDQFHRLYYHSASSTWKTMRYRGTPIAKCPLDVWLYQEIVAEQRPAWIVETGTYCGGSAYLLGDLCDTLGHGQVVSVDLAAQPDLPQHDRVRYLAGSSTAADVVEQVKGFVDDGPVLVILDSDHSEAHVRAELDVYAPLVTPGSYLVVEDSNVNGHPALPSFGPGPMEALDDFLRTSDDFVIDEHMSRLFMTFNPRGYLKRVA